jgi:hypothetical protein
MYEITTKRTIPVRDREYNFKKRKPNDFCILKFKSGEEMTSLEEGLFETTDPRGKCGPFLNSLEPWDKIPWLTFCKNMLKDECMEKEKDNQSRHCFYNRYVSGPFPIYDYMRESLEYVEAYRILALYCCKARAYKSLIALLVTFDVDLKKSTNREDYDGCVAQMIKDGEWECLNLMGEEGEELK